jgi:hypothetical protein
VKKELREKAGLKKDGERRGKGKGKGHKGGKA